MQSFLYRGETEREFELVLTKAVGLENIAYPEDDQPQEPLGVIIVAKDFDSSWIAFRESFLGWTVEFASCAAQFVKGFGDPHWQLLEDHVDGDDYSKSYLIYLSPYGTVVGETLCSNLCIASTLDEYQRMTKDQVATLCYASEMSSAR